MTRVTIDALVFLLLVVCAKSFQPVHVQSLVSILNAKHHQQRQRPSLPLRLDAASSNTTPEGGTPQQPQDGSGFLSAGRFVSMRMIKPLGLSIVTAIFFSTSLTAPTAFAATPLPKSATMPDAEKTAMRGIQLEMEKKQQIETEEYNKRARQIEAKEGSKAREIFEKEYREAKQQKDQDLMEELEALQRQLLDQGIDPFNDMEGYRQCFLLKTGKNLAEVEGTDQYADAQIVKMGLTKQSYSFQKEINRQLVKMMVEDYKNRGIDPLPEFANRDNHQKHAKILFMPKSAATKKLATMQQNMALYGQVDAPKAGELSLKEMLERDPDIVVRNQEAINKAINKGDRKDQEGAAKAAVKVKEEQEKAQRKAEAQKAKDEARAAKRREKQEAQALKDAEKEQQRIAKKQEKQEKVASKAAVTAAAATAAAATSTSQGAGEWAAAAIDEATVVQSEVDVSEDASSLQSLSLDDFEDDSKFADETGPVIIKSIGPQKSGLTIAKVGGFIAVAVGGKFVIDRMSQPSVVDEAERQRQFNLLMGITDDADGKGGDPSGSVDKTKAIGVETIATASKAANGDLTPTFPAAAPPAPMADIEAPRKRGLGIKSIFTKKKNERETDLNVLMSQSATAPEVAMILAKLLTFGAPGRFPMVSALAGGMPLESFDLAKAKEILESAVEEAGITREEGAEVFANVVNCMLIDIIDLASSSLGKEPSVTYDAINIVIDFMNHAASLYDAVAEGVEITPVTYGGILPKSKLEQLYGAYAFSAMIKMDGDMNDRIELLRNVFSIAEKKAEGIIMNASQKQMMEMLKTEDGQKQMEEMMSGMMGGMEGMEGLGAMAGLMGGTQDAEPNPEQLKSMLTMLKSMKDSGTIPPEELSTVREQFRESFGSSIDDILKQADNAGGEMSTSDKELLDLMKAILED